MTHLVTEAAASDLTRSVKVVLTDDSSAMGMLPSLSGQGGSPCDCDCACTGGTQTAVPLLAAPASCYLEVTYDCPNHCPACGNVHVDRGHPLPARLPLPARQWDAILDRLGPSVGLVRLTGGEPTHHPEFGAILDVLERRAMPYVLLTSGRWPDAAWLLERLAATPLFRGFLISLHGPTAAVHEAFTASKGSYADACLAIQAASARGFHVSANAVITRQNWHRLEKTVERALALGARQVLVGRLIGRCPSQLAVTEAELRAALREVRRMEHRGLPVRVGNCVPHCFEFSSAHACGAGFSYVTVDPWGNVRPCNHARLIAGNLLETPLDAIWNGPALRSWRGLGDPACMSCAVYANCGGGCRAVATERGRDPLARRPVATASDGAACAVALYRGAVPVPRWRAESHEHGAALTREGRAVLVSHDQMTRLNTLDPRADLDTIQRAQGNETLALVGQLWVQGLMDLALPSTVPGFGDQR